jgi:methylmalonyl-CoA mutase N-terminal domain/subunit
MMAHTVGHLLDKLLDKFQIDENGLYYNVRLEEEQNKRKTFTASRKNNLKGVNQYTKNKAHKDGHMTNHMENVNINIDNINNIKEEFKNSEIFIEQLAKRHSTNSQVIKSRMKNFWLEKSDTFDKHITTQEVKKYFGNWLKIDLTKNPLHRINQ